MVSFGVLVYIEESFYYDSGSWGFFYIVAFLYLS